ncbi:Oidioi.mRNA.OKI2018_I69.chr2.g5109.t1.cds [Oikopleura dioica]|uniref:Oidioi.mRNA.OKI2018_I69.chr2.g5109.t1.cds n=1 Tax=Oikopleura dioica TaxID=34765 RepID=A0ABN7T5Z8_OIKDI|nr:Oidioi.mRNA.OKI2018_I69.chr2.g5109.t1.cds [Oikopleura dioica]
MARIIQRDKDGRPFFVPPPPPETNPEDEERNMEIKTALDSPLEELAAEMKTFKLDINEELNRIFNQSSTLQTKPVASIKN